MRRVDAEPRIASAKTKAKPGGARFVDRQRFDGDSIDGENDVPGIRAAVDGDQDIVIAFEIDLEMEIAGSVALSGGLGWEG
jgi:hypothetical protein